MNFHRKLVGTAVSPEAVMSPVPHMALAALATTLGALCTPSYAEVKSLTSDELTETYIEDSTIIVTPATRQQPEQERRSISYTISPGEPLKTEPEYQADLANRQAEQQAQLQRSIETARQANQESPFLPPQEVAVAPLRAPIPIPFGVQIPEGPFDLNMLLGQQGMDALPYGDQLNLVNNGKELVMTIGNIPGYAPIQVDQAFRGRFIDVVPLPQGGAEIRYNLDALRAP